MEKFSVHKPLLSKKASQSCVYHECGRLCSPDDTTYLITRLELVEGKILEQLDATPHITLHELLKKMDFEPCIVSMGVGSLIGQGLVKGYEYGHEAILELI